MDKPKENLGVLDDWFAENYDEAWTPERKAELIKGMGYVCAMVYQEAFIPFGLG